MGLLAAGTKQHLSAGLKQNCAPKVFKHAALAVVKQPLPEINSTGKEKTSANGITSVYLEYEKGKQLKIEY